MKKLTKEQVEEIRKLYSSGEYNQNKLSEMFNVSQDMIGYWTNEDMRRKTIDRTKRNIMEAIKNKTDWKSKNPERARVYLNNYIKKRYHEDPEFRRKYIASMVKYQKKARANGTLWALKHPDKVREYARKSAKKLWKKGRTWAQRHPEEYAKRRATYLARPETKERVKNYSRKYYQKHKQMKTTIRRETNEKTMV